MRPDIRFVDFDRDPAAQLGNSFVVAPQDELPQVTVLEDVFVLPDYDAIYTGDGRRLYGTRRSFVPNDLDFAAKTLARFNQNYASHAPEQVEIPADFDTRSDEVYFAGHAWAHYGHFLMDAMARFWALEDFPDTMPVLYTDRLAKGYKDLPYVSPVIDALGLRDRAFSVDRPTRFKKLILPTASMQNVHRVYHAHARPHIATARFLLKDYASQFKDKRVYLSRSKLGKNLRQSGQEAMLEDRLKGDGFVVVYPETLSLIQQVDIFNNAASIAGTAGSAFHTSLFSLPEFSGRIAMLSWDKINNRYLMVDLIKAYPITYVNSCKIEDILENERISSLSIDVDKSYDAIIEAVI
ncbi:glycosyltransferase family 61 protein [Asticcacaulis solisilvae]|uniref:glycosyltransferase family 61 protein n=1 Tax=Asticcacaulis solisilvae TaxID=1217274 RepID=UPI003FD8C699